MNILAALGFSYRCANPKKIYVARLTGVGDILLTTPILVALKKKYTKAKITFGCSSGIYYDIISTNPNIDNFDFPSGNIFRLPTNNVIKYLIRKFSFIKARFLLNMKYDLVVLFALADRGLDYKKHIVDHFAEAAGVSLQERQPIIYLNEEDEGQAISLLDKANVNKDEPFIVIFNDTDKGRYRDWDGFDKMVERIHRKYKIKILTLPPKPFNDGPIGSIRIETTDIRVAAAIIKKCSLFVGVDGGQTHIASAFDIKIVSIHIGYPVELYGCLSPHTKFVNNDPFLFFDNNREWEKKSISVDRVMEQVDISLSGIAQEIIKKG